METGNPYLHRCRRRCRWALVVKRFGRRSSVRSIPRINVCTGDVHKEWRVVVGKHKELVFWATGIILLSAAENA